MPHIQRSGRSARTTLCVLAVGAASALCWSVPASSQSLFEALFGLPSAGPSPRMTPRSTVIGPDGIRFRLAPPMSSFGSSGSAANEGSGSYTTMCVRMCDGYYFPISYRAQRGRFQHDAEVCQSRCGGTDARLFYYPSSRGDMTDAVDLTGRGYAQLPVAFLHRKKLVSGCACRPEPWSQASLARHQQYALAAGRGTAAAGEARVASVEARGTGTITIIAGNYPDSGSQSRPESRADTRPETKLEMPAEPSRTDALTAAEKQSQEAAEGDPVATNAAAGEPVPAVGAPKRTTYRSRRTAQAKRPRAPRFAAAQQSPWGGGGSSGRLQWPGDAFRPR